MSYLLRSSTNNLYQNRSANLGNSGKNMSLFGAQSSAASASNPTQGRNPSSNAQSSSDSKIGDLSKDIAVSQPPEDSISDVRFSPASEHLAVASWDKKVRIYEVDQNGNTQGKALFEHEGPVLNCCWSKVGAQSFRLSDSGD